MDKQMKKYTLPEEAEPSMVSESLGTYNETSRQIILDIPRDTDADMVCSRVNLFYTQLINELAEEQKFYRLFDEWWEKTCIYSGPGICYKNDEFRRIREMGTKTIYWIDKLKTVKPEYMHRHISWLRRGGTTMSNFTCLQTDFR